MDKKLDLLEAVYVLEPKPFWHKMRIASTVRQLGRNMFVTEGNRASGGYADRSVKLVYLVPMSQGPKASQK